MLIELVTATALAFPVVLAEAAALWLPEVHGSKHSAAVVAAIAALERVHELTRMALMVLTIGTWASTFLLSVPCHNRLSKGYHVPTTQRLVFTN